MSAIDKKTEPHRGSDLSAVPTAQAGWSVGEAANVIKKQLGYKFKNLNLLTQALTHSSANISQVTTEPEGQNWFSFITGRKTSAPPPPKNGHPPNNERLEFLGDAILGMVITELLYHRYPNMAEGEMTVIKSDLVSRPVLAEKSQLFGLDKLVIIGKGIKDKSLPVSILANIFESLVAAIYLDKGIEPVYKVISAIFDNDIESASKNGLHKNYKALLQDYSQRRFSAIPHYKVIKQSGPKHQPLFEVMARVGNESYGPGIGHTKKEAEQAAAKTALEAIEPKK